MGVSDIVRQGVLPSVTASEPNLYLGAVTGIAEKIQRRALQAYAEFPSHVQSRPSIPADEFDFEEWKSDVNHDMESWIESEIWNSRWTRDDPLGALKASDNPNAFQVAGVNFEQNWDSVIHDMAFEAMRADVYETMKGNGWDERTGFPYTEEA